MLIKATIVRTIENKLDLSRTGSQTIGEYIDETIRLWCADEEQIAEVCLSFSEEDRKLMSKAIDPATRKAKKARRGDKFAV